MIKTLKINNYALIKELEAEFIAGMNVITGETGAGKSILLGALGLLCGSKADPTVIGKDSQRTTVAGVFDVATDSSAVQLLKGKGIEINLLPSGLAEIEIYREITSGGRNSSFVNDERVPIAFLKELGKCLVDIHSQHQSLLFAESDYQLYLLDRIAGNGERLEKYKQAYSEYRKKLSEYSALKIEIEKNRADADFISFRLEEIEKENIDLDEWQRFEKEAPWMESAAANAEAVSDARRYLSDSEGACESVENALRLIDSLDTDTAPWAQKISHDLASALKLLQEAAGRLDEEFAENETLSPEKFEELRSRHLSIASLMDKYHVDSPEGLLEKADDFKRRLEIARDGDSLLAEKEKVARMAKKNAMTLARILSEERHKAAESFSKALLETARPLGMENLKCEISFIEGKLSPEGIDSVDFLFAFNKNSDLLPLRQGASGGEMSRLTLAVKAVLAKVVDLPTMILDEIDTGVSGKVAEKMASLMVEVSDRVQIIAITHLPAVASRGLKHFKVYKSDTDTETMSSIKVLEERERVMEIATMMGGENPSEAMLSSARQLLGLELKF